MATAERARTGKAKSVKVVKSIDIGDGLNMEGGEALSSQGPHVPNLTSSPSVTIKHGEELDVHI